MTNTPARQLPQNLPGREMPVVTSPSRQSGDWISCGPF